ncbi:hypothetical protein RB195_024191 [Necator americanus]|uniref:Uncharacterized protein n=1 Tax=Necator americanus TaxID=51031 RepID=A0ABR1EMA8_NECAM
MLAPLGCPLKDLEYADDDVIFRENNAKLQHVVNPVPKLAAAKYKQMWELRAEIRMHGQPILSMRSIIWAMC